MPMDVHHLYYMLMRCEGLGLPVGPLDEDVGLSTLPVVHPSHAGHEESRSLFSLQDTIQSVQTLWGAKAVDPDRAFRYLHRVCAHTLALTLHSEPKRYLEGYEDMPGSHAVPLHSFAHLRDLYLNDVLPARIGGWDRLCIQLERLQCAQVGVADLAEVFLGLVARDAAAHRRHAGQPARETPEEAATPPSDVANQAAGAHVDAAPANERKSAPHPPLPAAAWHALRYLHLGRNELTFVPSEAIEALPNLVHLDLSHNLLNAVPPALACLHSLRALNLQGNMIDSVLGIYDALSSVRSLNLAENRLESLCGLERLQTLEQVDLRKNSIADSGEVGRLATLPRISHVWIRGNPVMELVPDARVACFALFALENKEIRLDDQPCGFFEQRRVNDRLAHQVGNTPRTKAKPAVAPPPSRPSADMPTEPAPRRRPRRTDPGPLPQRVTEVVHKRRPRRSELLPNMETRPTVPPVARSESLKQRMERLRGDTGDDYLRVFARGEFDAPKKDSGSHPIHSVWEDPAAAPAYADQAPSASFPLPVRVAFDIVSSPVGAAATAVGLVLTGLYVRKNLFRRIPTAAHITPTILASNRMLVGKVTSVGDADGFRVYHTPGLPVFRSLFFRAPTKPAALRNQTISVRIAGADAPESAHFGRTAQPFALEAKAELRRLVEGKTVWLDMARVDQYGRLVATPYVFLPPYVFGRTNVSYTLVRKGLATVYRSAGAEYGKATWFFRTFFGAKNGGKRLERAEEYAKFRRLGMWSKGRHIETPAEYKRRAREAEGKP